MADIKIGAWTETKDFFNFQKLCDQVKSEVEKITCKTYVTYIAVQYRCQVVAGCNYVVKVFCGVEDYIHLNLFQELPGNGGKVVVLQVEQEKTKEDPLVPF